MQRKMGDRMACTDVDRWMGHPVGSTRLEVSVVHWQRCLHWMWILCFASPCLAWVIVQFVANGGIYWKKIDGDSIRMANCGQTNNREICSIVVPCCCALAGEEQSDDSSSSSSSSSGTAAAALGTAVQRSPSTIPTIPNSRPPDYFVPLERGGAAGPNGARSARPRSLPEFAIWRRPHPYSIWQLQICTSTCMPHAIIRTRSRAMRARLHSAQIGEIAIMLHRRSQTCVYRGRILHDEKFSFRMV